MHYTRIQQLYNEEEWLLRFPSHTTHTSMWTNIFAPLPPSPPPPPKGNKEVCVWVGGGGAGGRGGLNDTLISCQRWKTPAVGTNRDLLLMHTQHLQQEVWNKWKLAFWFPNTLFFPTGDQKYMTNMTIFWIWRVKIHDGHNHSLNVIIKNTLQMLKSGPQKYMTDTTIQWMWSSKIHDGHNHSMNVVLKNTWWTQPFYECGPHKCKTDATIFWIWCLKIHDSHSHFLNWFIKNAQQTQLFLKQIIFMLLVLPWFKQNRTTKNDCRRVPWPSSPMSNSMEGMEKSSPSRLLVKALNSAPVLAEHSCSSRSISARHAGVFKRTLKTSPPICWTYHPEKKMEKEKGNKLIKELFPFHPVKMIITLLQLLIPISKWCKHSLWKLMISVYGSI